MKSPEYHGNDRFRAGLFDLGDDAVDDDNTEQNSSSSIFVVFGVSSLF
jgi:hypothetical protein